MFTDKCVMCSISSGCTKPVLDTEYNNKSNQSNQLKGRMLSIFSTKLFKLILKIFGPTTVEVTT